MKTVSGKDLARIVEKNGWTLLRINGSHHFYGKEGSNVRLSIPFTKTKLLRKASYDTCSNLRG